MKSLLGSGFGLAAIFLPLQARAQSWPLPCNPVVVSPDGPPNLKSANKVYLKFFDSKFPDRFVSPYNPTDVTHGLQNLLRDALTEAALKWNRSCGPLPVLNDQPVLVPVSSTFELSPGTEGSFLVEVDFEDGFAEPSKDCGDPFPGELCHPAIARTLVFPNYARLVIFSKSGRVNHPDWTFFAYRGAYHRFFQHELGHLLLLDHDNCPRSPVQQPIPNRFECAPHDVTCELAARNEHCETMEASFEPLDPLEKVLGDDPLSLCRLRHYCDIDPWLPWSRLRSGCLWIEDVRQTYVDTYDQDGVHIGGAVHNYISFGCFGGGFNFGTAGGMTETSPFLMVGFPKNGATAHSGLLKLTGWAWGRTHALRELRVFVDREEARLVDFEHPIGSQAICSLGFDPEHCDPNAGFSGKVDIHGLAPGAHKLLIVATDMADDPKPTYIQLDFVVPETYVNHPPSPQDDEVTVTMRSGAGRETSIPVLDNDFDPDGQTIALASDPIATHPASGSLRVESGQLVYTPFPWSTGSDSFRYQIVDSLGAPAVAEVRIQFMEIILLP